VPEIVVRIGREVQTELEKAVKGEG
jgi:hypothetical protein